MSFDQLWAEAERLQAEVDTLKPRVKVYRQAVEALRALVGDLKQEDHPEIWCCEGREVRKARAALAAVDALEEGK